MANQTQPNGMQEMLVQLNAKSAKGTETAIKAIRKAGGRVLYAVPPQIIVALLPQSEATKLVGKNGIIQISPGPIENGNTATSAELTGNALKVWNEHLNIDRRLRAINSAETSKRWDHAEYQPLHPPEGAIAEEVVGELARLEHAAMPMALAATPIQTIPVLAGRIGIGLIFVDSTQPEFQIIDSEHTKVISEVTEGVNMLSGFEPRAGIEWFFDVKRPGIALPISDFSDVPSTSWEDIWRNAAMAEIGHKNSIEGMNDYISSIKTQFNAQWAYAIYVTKYPKPWFAYHWGNHLVLDFQMNEWGIDNLNLIVAHETAHVFGGADEYASSNCNCGDLFGRYQVPNGNCERCAPTTVNCLMKSNAPSICDYTRGHLGWTELATLRKGSVNLKKMRTFDFETGVIGSDNGADVLWEHVDAVTRLLVPQNGAMLTRLGEVDFDIVSYQSLSSLSYTATPINGSDDTSNKLTPGSVIAIRTNSGRFAKMKIKTYGVTLGIDYVTYQ